MKISRRNFCLLMAGACCTGVLAACGSGSSSTASSSAASASAAASGEVRDELIFVNYRDIRDLNPHLYAGEMYAQSILYDTLVSITADGYEGCLAESWDIHLLPSITSDLVVLASLDVGWAIINISTLSFLGLGVQAPTPEWGAMLNEAKNVMTSNPVQMIAPGIAIVVLVCVFNLMGDALRDVLDPKEVQK